MMPLGITREGWSLVSPAIMASQDWLQYVTQNAWMYKNYSRDVHASFVYVEGKKKPHSVRLILKYSNKQRTYV